MSWSEFAESESPRIPEAENVTELEIFHDVFQVTGGQRGWTKAALSRIIRIIRLFE